MREVSDETRSKMSARKRGRLLSQAHTDAISEGMKRAKRRQMVSYLQEQRDRPTYRFELLHRPKPDVPVGTTARVALTLGSNHQHEILEYMGAGRWLPVALAKWLNGDTDSTR